MASTMKSLGRLIPSKSSLFLCDMQEKFRPMISYFPQIVQNSNKVLNAAQIMDIPTFVTEQYPKVTISYFVRLLVTENL